MLFPVSGQPYRLSVFSTSAGRGGGAVDMLAAARALVLFFVFSGPFSIFKGHSSCLCVCILTRILPRSQFLVVATIAFNTHHKSDFSNATDVFSLVCWIKVQSDQTMAQYINLSTSDKWKFHPVLSVIAFTPHSAYVYSATPQPASKLYTTAASHRPSTAHASS